MKYLYLAIFLCLGFSVAAQEDPLYAQYINNPLVINPAYAGLNNNFNLAVSYRKQWTGFEGSPGTVNVGVHASLWQNRMGLGAMLVSDRIGPSSSTEAHLAYAYRIKFSHTVLSLGLQGGVVNFRSNDQYLNVYDPTDPAFSNAVSFTRPTVGAGLILHGEKFFAGLSAPRLAKIDNTLLNDSTRQNVTTNVFAQHYYASLAYLFYLSPRVRFKPSALLRYVKGAPLSTDYTASFLFDDRVTAGMLTRNFNTVGLMVQMRFAGAYRFGYIFEVPLKTSVGTRFNTHEVSLSMNMAMFEFHKDSPSIF